MGRKPNQIVKGKHSSAIFFLYTGHSNSDNKYQLKLRLTKKNKERIELPVIFNREKVKIVKNHFNNGRVIGGYENGNLNRINLHLVKMAHKAVNIADDYHDNKKQLTTSTLSKLIDRPDLEPVLPKEVEIVEYVEDSQGDKIGLTKEDVQLFEAKIDSGEYGDKKNLNFESKEDFDQAKIDAHYENILIENSKTIESRYESKSWDRTNIFQALGYIRYGTKVDAAGDKVSFIPFSYQKLFKKLIYYRINQRPTENIENLNEEWVHDFYRFIIKGFERRLQKVEANPFKLDKTYLKEKNATIETYNINSFGEGIHKHVVGYIKQLYKEKLINIDFTQRIQPEAFTKVYGGNKSNYGEAIYFITPKEFLTLINADLKKEILEVTRDLFICQVMIGALRVSNLTGSKLIEEIDHITLVSYKQAKVKNLITNVMLKPVKDILKKYDGSLPVLKDSVYNENLKELFKHLHLSRIVKKKIKKLDAETIEEIKLHDLISSKFARSTYYVLQGAMGIPIETIAKRAGHSSTDIAMKHYYNISNNYTESDIVELLEKFK